MSGSLYPDDFPEEPVAGITDDEVEDFLATPMSAVLRGAKLKNTDLRGAHLSGANLRGAVLRGAYLTDANLRGADLSGARYDADTVWPEGVDPKSAGVVEVGP